MLLRQQLTTNNIVSFNKHWLMDSYCAGPLSDTQKIHGHPDPNDQLSWEVQSILPCNHKAIQGYCKASAARSWVKKNKQKKETSLNNTAAIENRKGKRIWSKYITKRKQRCMKTLPKMKENGMNRNSVATKSCVCCLESLLEQSLDVPSSPHRFSTHILWVWRLQVVNILLTVHCGTEVYQ